MCCLSNSPRQCMHEWAKYSDGVYCRKCYAAKDETPLVKRIKALEARLEVLEKGNCGH